MYSIGTICIGQNFVRNKEANGMECEILENAKKMDLEYKDGFIEHGVMAHKVRWEDRLVDYQPFYRLRPKHIPGSWDELEKTIGWRPTINEVIK